MFCELQGGRDENKFREDSSALSLRTDLSDDSCLDFPAFDQALAVSPLWAGVIETRDGVRKDTDHTSDRCPHYGTSTSTSGGSGNSSRSGGSWVARCRGGSNRCQCGRRRDHFKTNRQVALPSFEVLLLCREISELRSSIEDLIPPTTFRAHTKIYWRRDAKQMVSLYMKRRSDSNLVYLFGL